MQCLHWRAENQFSNMQTDFESMTIEVGQMIEHHRLVSSKILEKYSVFEILATLAVIKLSICNYLNALLREILASENIDESTPCTNNDDFSNAKFRSALIKVCIQLTPRESIIYFKWLKVQNYI